MLRLHAIGGDDRLSSDELGYIGDANKLIHLSGYNSFHWAPGTPILFAILAWLSGHDPVVLAALVNAAVYGRALTPTQLDTVLAAVHSLQP